MTQHEPDVPERDEEHPTEPVQQEAGAQAQRQARALQLGVPPVRTWGGRRKGAGRKPGPDPGPWHAKRPEVEPGAPLHITMKLAEDLPELDATTLALTEQAVEAAREKPGFRIVHHVIEARHLHLIVEAESTAVLGRGLRGLGIRLARALNKVVGRKGTAIRERYSLRVLRREAVDEVLTYLRGLRERHVARGPEPGAR